MEAKCENHCPNCGAGQDHIEWFANDVCDTVIQYPATCKLCGTEFKEYHDLVYSGTEYDPPDFDNRYSLFMTNDCSKRQYEICQDITGQITTILIALAFMRAQGVPFKDEKISYNIACIRMFKFARIGVGDTDTDECIASHYKDGLIEEANIPIEDAYEESREFYHLLHQ